jgi:Na+/H+-dicarboxylate symporter
MGSTKSLLLALAGGLSCGALLRWSGAPSLLALAGAVRPAGALWLAALKMTLVPLIFAMVSGGARSLAGEDGGGRMAGRVLLPFAAMLLFAATLGMALSSAILAIWPVPQGAIAGLALVAPAHPAVTRGLAEELLAIIPTNPVAAAAQGEMTPLVVFAILFGVALTRIAPARRDALGTVIDALADTMMTIVQGVLWFAPLGIFALALGVALDAGLAMMAALAQYIVLQCLVASAAIVCCYPIAILFGGMSLRRFVRGIARPQAIAAGTTSSMATLPAMIDAAQDELGIDPALAGAILPLAVSTFRFGNLACGSSTLMFAAHLAGLHLSLGTIVTAVAVLLISNVGGAGLPAAAILYAILAPAFQVIGAPLELIPLFLAVYALPDIFDTTANVTGDLTVATVIARLARPAPVKIEELVLVST